VVGCFLDDYAFSNLEIERDEVKKEGAVFETYEAAVSGN